MEVDASLEPHIIYATSNHSNKTKLNIIEGGQEMGTNDKELKLPSQVSHPQLAECVMNMNKKLLPTIMKKALTFLCSSQLL